MPGYLTPPSSNASGVSITSVSGMSATNLQEAVVELNDNSNTIDLKADAIDLKTITPYANDSARDAAIPSPSEGQTVYLVSLKTIQVYNGTTWTAIAGGSDINQLLLAGI